MSGQPVDAAASGAPEPAVVILEPFDGHWPDVAPDAEVADTAVLIGRVHVGSRAKIGHGVVLRADIQQIFIREGACLQPNTVVHTGDDADTDVGEAANIGSGAILEGCVVGPGAQVGARAVVLTYARLGARSRVAAGAVVAEHQTVPDGVEVAGVPARVTGGDAPSGGALSPPGRGQE